MISSFKKKELRRCESKSVKLRNLIICDQMPADRDYEQIYQFILNVIVYSTILKTTN